MSSRHNYCACENCAPAYESDSSGCERINPKHKKKEKNKSGCKSKELHVYNYGCRGPKGDTGCRGPKGDDGCPGRDAMTPAFGFYTAVDMGDDKDIPDSSIINFKLIPCLVQQLNMTMVNDCYSRLSNTGIVKNAGYYDISFSCYLEIKKPIVLEDEETAAIDLFR